MTALAHQINVAASPRERTKLRIQATSAMLRQTGLPDLAVTIMAEAANEVGGLAILRQKRPPRPLAAVRQRTMYDLWLKCRSVSLGDIARAFHLSDHSAARHGILAHARAIGLGVATVSELRGDDSAGADYDATLLAYHAAHWRTVQKRTLDGAGRSVGVGRGQWRKVENGEPVRPGAMLRVCRAIELDPLRLVMIEADCVDIDE